MLLERRNYTSSIIILIISLFFNIYFILFTWLCQVLVATHAFFQLWRASSQLHCVGSSSLTRVKPRPLAFGVWVLATGPPEKSCNRFLHSQNISNFTCLFKSQLLHCQKLFVLCGQPTSNSVIFNTMDSSLCTYILFYTEVCKNSLFLASFYTRFLITPFCLKFCKLYSLALLWLYILGILCYIYHLFSSFLGSYDI